MQRGHIIRATFRPATTKDLRDGALDWIGHRSLWEAAFVIDMSSRYGGTWAFVPVYAPGMPKKEFPGFWAPEADLMIEDLNPLCYGIHDEAI